MPRRRLHRRHHHGDLAANAAHHYRNLRVLFTWLLKRKQITRNPFDETEPPKVPEKITPLLSDEKHAAVLLACSGKDLASLRDTAIILLFIDTGMRVSELHSLQVDDIDLKTEEFLIRGKGKKLRWIKFGATVGLAPPATSRRGQSIRSRRAPRPFGCRGATTSRSASTASRAC